MATARAIPITTIEELIGKMENAMLVKSYKKRAVLRWKQRNLLMLMQMSFINFFKGMSIC